MKNFANNSVTTNSLMTGRKTMTVDKATRRRMDKQVRRFLCLLVAVLFLAGFAASAFAGTHYVDDKNELMTILDHIENGTGGADYAGREHTFVLQDNIALDQDYEVNVFGKEFTFLLGHYNFQGTGKITFIGQGSNSVVNIYGSTMAFVDGTHLNLKTPPGGQLTLNYHGVYTSGETDSIGELTSDDIIVNLTAPGSSWNAKSHDVIVGDAGRGRFNIAGGNEGKSLNLYIGNQSLSHGTMDISGTRVKIVGGQPVIVPTQWHNKENFVVGEEGTGVLNLYDGALLETGNFAVGTENGGNGYAHIYGAGTHLNILGYGGSTAVDPHTNGIGNMRVELGAQVWVGFNDNQYDPASAAPDPHSGILALGRGGSTFDNAYLMVDRGTINGPDNAMTFTNFALFEGSNHGFVVNNAGTHDFADQGDGVTLQSLTINNNAIFSPGYGSSELWEKTVKIDFDPNGDQADLVYLYKLGRNAEPFYADGTPIVDRKGYPLPVGRYGGFEFTGDFHLAADGIAIFDFDPEGATGHPNAGVKQDQHRDFVNLLTGAATLDGTVHFRPMPGYYQENVEIDFMTNSTGTPTLSLWPRRWFVEDSWEIDNGTLKMQREERPFYLSGVSPNEKSVGVALDFIYNEEWKEHNDKLMLGQEQTDWYPVLDWLWGMSDEEFRKAMRQLSGETRAASFFMPIRAPWRFAFDRVNWRKRDNHVYFGQQNILSPYIAKQDIWVTPYYDYMHTSDDGNTSSASTSRVSFMAGYDRALSKHAAAGFLFGYSQPKLNQEYSRVIADDYLFGLHYNTRVYHDFELKLWGSYGIQHYRLNRSVPISGGENVDARYKGNSVTSSVQIARPYSFYKGVIRPLAALDYSFVKQSEAEEDGYEQIALRYCSSDWSQLFGRVGVRGDFGWKRISLTSSVSYSYQIAGQVAPSGTNQFIHGDRHPGNPTFDIEGPNLSRTFVNIGLGSQIYLNRLKSRMFFMQYNGNYGKRTNAQYASLGYQMTF